MEGTLYGIGVGPGDPDLITVKGLRLLRAAPVLLYPAPLDGESLARSIVAGHLPGGQTEIAMRTPMSAAAFPADEVYERAAAEVVEHLEAGRDVAAICEGDPFFYGSFMYLFARVAGRHRVEVVPGVSSLTACAATVGAPLAARDDVLAVLPATLGVERLRAALIGVEAAAIIKVGRHLGAVRELLDELGMTARAHYIERATLGNERAMALAEVEDDTAPYFSMVLVHARGVAWR